MVTRSLSTLLILFIPLFFTSNVSAGCDACLQSAIRTASSQISASLQTLNATANTNVAATQALTQTVTTSSATLNALMESQHILLMNGLDAAAIRLEASTDVVSATVESTSDHLATTISQTIKDYGKTQQFLRNRDVYGPMALPLSGDIAANRAPLLAEALASYKTALDDSMIKFKQWALSPIEFDETTTVRQIRADERIIELSPMLDELVNGVLTQEQTSKLEELYRLMLLPVPLDQETMAPRERIIYLQEIDKLSKAYYVLMSDLLLKAPQLSPEGWDIGYIHVDTVEERTSLNEFVRAETERKMLSPTWHFDVKTKTEAGLLREQVNQHELTNYLLSMLYAEEQKTLALMAVEQ